MDPGAWVAGLWFAQWDQAHACGQQRLWQPDVAPYVPGAFYQRELPCLLHLIQALPFQPSIIVVDGYVTLGASAQPGLGWHLWQALSAAIPVIGVAKTRFTDTPAEQALLRGNSERPLFVTAAGLPQAAALTLIRSMHGPHRLPTLLKRVDHLARHGP